MSASTTGRFPLPWSASVAQWWATSSASPLQIQNEIFSLAPFWSKADHRVAAQQFVQLSGKNRFLNEISVKASGESAAGTTQVKGNVVLLHGYGAGIGFFFRNIEGLTQSLVSRMDFYALDWLGMGLSSRPKFKIQAKTPLEKIREAESFFLDALEEWRVQRNLDKMTLVAHSLGGYLAVRYTNKYPDRVEKLILVSPVGIPKNPYEKDTAPEPTLNTNEPVSALNAEFSDIDEPVQKNPLPRWVTTLWDANFSPFYFVRLAGPLGPKLTSGWTGRRFNHIPESQQKMLHNYAYEIFKGKASGEYALAYLLAPGAYARSCLRDVIPVKVPVLIMYGDRDWMDEGAGRKAAEVANKKPGGDVKVVQISNAGHHCYLDNPPEFDQVVIDFINRPPRKQSI